ncbi:DUF4132 domain-containing protein [Escherichia coli]|nr:DUF4132 domain-containing protein [Escherichia coli]
MRRRWTAEQFRLFLVEHPLVRHLTRRLLCGGYILEENTLIACFRKVAEDSTYSDAQDELFTLQETSVFRMCLEISPWNPPLHLGKFILITNSFLPFRQLDRGYY